MPRRRLSVAKVIADIFGVPHPVAKSALTIATHSNRHRTGLYDHLAKPLDKSEHSRTKRKKRVKNSVKTRVKTRVKTSIPTVTARRFSPTSETSGKSNKKLLTTYKAMPYRRKSGYKSRSRPRRRRLSIPLALPRQKVVRMRVVARGTITANAGVVGIVKMKANSLNDPTTDFGQTLPLGLDQWASQYQKYIVLGCKVKARFMPVTHTGPVAVGLHLADNNTALTNTDHYKELPNTSQGIVTTQRDYLTRVIKYSGKRFWRLTNIKDDSEQEATFSLAPGDPTDVAYIHVYVQDMQNANNTTVEVQVEQEFIVLLTDPITLAQSSL